MSNFMKKEEKEELERLIYIYFKSIEPIDELADIINSALLSFTDDFLTNKYIHRELIVALKKRLTEKRYWRKNRRGG